MVFIIQPLLYFPLNKIEYIDDISDIVIKKVLPSNNISKSSDLEGTLNALITGKTILLIKGCSDVLLIDTIDIK